MREIWKDIPGFEGIYQVSNTGLVRSLNFNHITGLIKEIAQKTDKYGYKVVQLHNNGKRKHITVHRLVAMTFMPESHGLPQVNHIDRDKTNNRLDPKDGMGVRFGVIVTLKEINGVNRIDEFIKNCTLNGWLVNRLDIQTRIEINEKINEDIEFE